MAPAFGRRRTGPPSRTLGGFIPIALLQISRLNPNGTESTVLRVGFALAVSAAAADRAHLARIAAAGTRLCLGSMPSWLERHPADCCSVITVLLAVVLLRDGIAGLAGETR